MPRLSINNRSPWEDRFRAPTLEGLWGALEPEAAEAGETLRHALGSDFGLHERLEWCGVPWKWAITFRADRTTTSDTLVYLVPNPEAPTAVVRLTHEQFSALPLRKLSRHIREGLAPTRLVAGVCWPEWKVQTANQAQDLIGLIGLLHTLTPSQA